MLKLIYFELRKHVLRRQVIAAIALLLCLNIAVIYKDYLSGDGLMGYFMPHSKETKVEWAFYRDMHAKLDGPITAEKARFVTDENNRLNALVADKTFSREHQPGTYTGYIWNDYAMFFKYFYEPMKYAAKYEVNMSQTVQKAKENVSFYSDYHNAYEVSRNEYIVDHYEGRKISLFYDGKPWGLMFGYHFSDLLIMLLLLLVLVPLYVHEKETNMNELILTCKRGRSNMGMAKVAAMALFTGFLVVAFACVNVAAFGSLYRLGGYDMPLYALDSYQNTPLSISVLSFYGLLVLYKFGGAVVIGLWLSLLSTLFQRVIYPYMLSVLLIAAGLYASGFLASVELGKTIVALASPFTLLKADSLHMELLGMKVGNRFILRSIAGLAVQGLIGTVLCFAIRRYGSSRRVKRSRLMNPIKAGA
ncbi:hypothetical protein [Paenibacillus sp. MMS18-CY102]|uniref:hypothetical protein n=1 Tax=Paenibacillus sp. MMS18-CY102 TaxID=2682849 RepID=UPI001365F043|nr:hypothetical protein [Paenibacillus sp. MMS18-CY102]MWC29501.1 hypothetical protein [Paenibacillus sp. MMS18-CY102]